MTRLRERVPNDDRGASVVLVMIFLLVFSVVALAGLDRTQVSFEASAVARDIRAQEYAADAAVDFAVSEVLQNPTSYIGKPCNIEVRGVNGVPSTTVDCSLTTTVVAGGIQAHTPTTSPPSQGKATSLTLGKPAGTSVGDLLIAQIAYEYGVPYLVAAPPGWTLAASDGNGTTTQSSNIVQALFTRIIDATDATITQYTFSFTKNGNPQEVKVVGGILRYSGAVGVFNASQSVSRGDGGQLKVGGIDANKDDRVVIFWSVFKDVVIPAPNRQVAGETVQRLMNPRSSQDIAAFAGDFVRRSNGSSTGEITTQPRKPDESDNLSDKWVGRMVSLTPRTGGGAATLTGGSGIFTARIGNDRIRAQVDFPTATTADVKQWSVLP